MCHRFVEVPVGLIKKNFVYEFVGFKKQYTQVNLVKQKPFDNSSFLVIHKVFVQLLMRINWKWLPVELKLLKKKTFVMMP